MANTFQEFLSLSDEVDTLVRKLRRRLRPFSAGEAFTPTMLGAVEDAAEEIATVVDPKTVELRPKDATDEEWNSSVVALLRSRIESLGFASSQRPRDTKQWMGELLLASEEFERSYHEFNNQIER